MTTYLVEAYTTKLDEPGRRGLAAAARAAAETVTREGVLIRYLGSIFVLEDEMCLHLFNAASAEAIRQANGRRTFGCERIVEIVEMRSSPTNRKELDMAQYLVERHLAGFPPEQLPAAAAAAKQKAQEISSEGADVRYVRSTWVPDTERCYCLFEASTRDAVAETQTRAALPYERIYEATFLTAEDV